MSVVDENGCWIYIGRIDPRASTPYGKIRVYDKSRPGPARNKKVTRQAHIVSYETFIGPVPEGHQLDHTCEVEQCIHPNHLEPVLPKENSKRREEAKHRSLMRHTARSDSYVGI